MVKNKIKIPEMFSRCLADGYVFEELTESDGPIPKVYFVGPDAPEITASELPTDGSKAYWFNTATNEVYVAQLKENKIIWILCEMIRLVCESVLVGDHFSEIAFGKLTLPK